MKEKELVIVLNKGQEDSNRNGERARPNGADTFTDPSNVTSI